MAQYFRLPQPICDTLAPDQDQVIHLAQVMYQYYQHDAYLYDVMLFEFLKAYPQNQQVIQYATSLTWLRALLEKQSSNELLKHHRFFLQRGADPNHVFSHRQISALYPSLRQIYYQCATPLTVASYQNEELVVEELIAAGGNLGFTNHHQRSLFSLVLGYYSDSFGGFEMAKALWDNSHPKHQSSIRMLQKLAANNDFFLPDDKGKVAIEYLYYYTQELLNTHPLCALLSNNSDWNHPAWMMHLFLSFKFLKNDFLDCFKNAGGNVNVTQSGDHALLYWIKNISDETSPAVFRLRLDKMLEYGLQINLRDTQGKTALHYLQKQSFYSGKKQMVQYFKSKGGQL